MQSVNQLQLDLSLQFAGQEKPFFNRLQASFASGELHFINGRNGVGKSTLFRLLQGAVLPGELVAGTVRIGDDAFLPADQQLNNLVKAIPQDSDVVLVSSFSVQQCLQLAMAPVRPRFAPLPVVPFPALLSSVGIVPDQRVRDLSGGQRQLLAIAMMLLKKPRVLLLDEPTAALDQANARLVMDTLVRLCAKEQVTMLVITHDADLMAAYAPKGSVSLVCNAETGERELVAAKK